MYNRRRPLRQEAMDHVTGRCVHRTTRLEISESSRLEILRCATVFTRKFWTVLVSRTILCNGWRARGAADLKIHTQTSPSLPISLSPPFRNGNAFSWWRAELDVFHETVTYFRSAVDNCQMSIDREDLGRSRIPLTCSKSCGPLFKMAVDSGSICRVWSWFEAYTCFHVCLQWYIYISSSYCVVSFLSFSMSKISVNEPNRKKVCTVQSVNEWQLHGSWHVFIELCRANITNAVSCWMVKTARARWKNHVIP